MDNLKRRGSSIPSASSQTLWSIENSTKDTQSSEGNSSNKHDKGMNVQVILRCRPLSEDEIRVNTPVMISCNELTREVTAVQNTGSKQIDKTFVFDKVFGPTSKQRDLYEQVVSPIVNEALEGYNCTIFTYGQTGTGKTYTMEGEGRKGKEAGVIPRAVQQIFDILEAQNTEYNMKVTFIEIYNEDITDLLALDESSKNIDERIKKPITLMEDGKGAVFVRGIEEEIVYTADQIFKILDKGSARKHTADTLLNKQSNRSHSMFTITVQIKECTSEGVELIKCGKLNLVDLAGSENILRSGAREGRAWEAGEINKSLLTLGRVINALVEHSGHVPYRDSKLMRLLRDSLGGRAKTCIIATVSPSVNCSEETFSTLDYTYRAKNIKNRPEVNQKKLMKLQDLYLYQQQLSTELTEKFEGTKKKFEQTEQALFDIEDKYRYANETIKEREYLIFNLLGSEKALTERAFELRVELENAVSELMGEISSEANAIVNDLQSNLCNQEQSIATFAQQQHENQLRTYETTQLISRVAEYADNEERQLLDKMAELLASSNARKKMIVQTVAHDHRESTNSTATKLYKEMSELLDFTSSVQEEWTSYMKEMAKHYIEDSTAVETRRDGLGGGLRHWGGLETKIMYTCTSSLASVTLEEADIATKSSISSIDYLLRVDHDASEKINSLVDPCHEDMREKQNSHLRNIVKIAENAEKCLINEYMMDETLCSTPRKREFNLPSMTSTEQLQTPSFEELLKKFRGAGSGKQENGDVNKSSGSNLQSIMYNHSMHH
ncbi:hypothetical protein LguiA_032239 [Lonicera macranthoides]